MTNAALFAAAGMSIASATALGLYYVSDTFVIYESLIFVTLFFTGFIFTSLIHSRGRRG